MGLFFRRVSFYKKYASQSDIDITSWVEKHCILNLPWTFVYEYLQIQKQESQLQNQGWKF